MVTEYFREAGYFNCRGEAVDLTRPGKLDYNFTMPFEDAYDGTDWKERKPGQPFFAQVHFHETHRNFYRDPENPVDPSRVQVPPYYPDHPITRVDWALYLETLQNLDKKVGVVLNRLQDEGLLENTIIFFTGDHGRPMHRCKQWLYDGGIHVPLIVAGPEIPPGVVNDDLISAIDWAPTWLRLAGLDAPSNMQGRPFLASKVEPREAIFAARDRCDETDDRIRCIRTKDFKYIRNFHPERPFTQFNAYKKLQYPVVTLMEVLHARGELAPEPEAWMAPNRPADELYNLKSDPYEVVNLAGDPAHQQTLENMKRQVDQWIEETGDQGEYPEDPEVAAKWDRDMWEPYFVANMKQKGLDPDVNPEDFLAWWEKRLVEQKGS